MGSLGGKIGFGVGLLTPVFVAVPVVQIIPGSCFFEGGCGEQESTGLILAALILLGLAVASGVVARILVNYFVNRQDH
jgi:hypothetical protein